jgi:DNA (cytosine-5)-methyltransferase 1
MPVSYSPALVADLLSVSKATLIKWERNGTLIPHIDASTGSKTYSADQLSQFEKFRVMAESRWDEEQAITPKRPYQCIELFAGAGGLGLGLERAGFQSVLLNEIDPHACHTLRCNRPDWNVIEGDVSDISFTPYKGNVDVLSGGFPCQAFSYAGKKLGFEDTRGTLFFQFGRAIQECSPNIVLAENVRGLISHDSGKTLHIISNALDELGYQVVPPKLMQAIFYKVPQKRERLFIVGIRKDLTHKARFTWPTPYHRILTVRDALKKGELYPEDVPVSSGQAYPRRKAEILAHVPAGGYWRDLPDDLQREYMKKSYFLGGGKTGIARRLSWDEPSLTLTCAPAQKQTERCHPEETRPLTVREYARIQTFPDNWHFAGSVNEQYKQIGNAVPVNLAAAVARRLVSFLNEAEANTGEPKQPIVYYDDSVPLFASLS